MLSSLFALSTMDMHAHSDSFHRFDRFNTKYSPIGQSLCTLVSGGVLCAI